LNFLLNYPKRYHKFNFPQLISSPHFGPGSKSNVVSACVGPRENSLMSLSNKRILITRTRHQASELTARLEALGATTLTIPTIEIASPTSFAALDAAITCLRTYDWLVFTSANAVEAFHRRAQFLHLTQLPKSIAVIGPATLRAANEIGLTVDLVPPQYIGESLAEALLPESRGKSFLLVRAAEARDTLPEALTASGATVTIAEAYRNQIPVDSIPALQHLFSDPASYPDAITFTSASTARNLFNLLDAAATTLPPDITLASIGPITSDTLRNLGHSPTIEAAEPTIPALVESLLAHFSGTAEGQPNA
jgi:uroporphyrinogen-III synthase